MFFSISNQCENNFTANYNFGSVWINVDAGWEVKSDDTYFVIYKGYADNFSLDSILNEIRESELPFDLGNYCVFYINKKSSQVYIRTDRYRGFPIYVDLGNSVNNLQKKSSTKWSDNIITVNPDITIEEYQFDIIGEIDTSTVDYSTAVSSIDKLLHSKTEKFLKNNQLPIKAHLSGGVDTLLVYSYLWAHTKNFELVKYAHIDYDRFWLLNSTDISRHWGYNQIHHWNEKCVLTSGAPGDEYMLRSPATIDRYLKLYNQSVVQLLRSPRWANCLHKDYFNRQKHQEWFNDQTVDHAKPLTENYWELCNTVINDWQHWHLGNTLTWTPLRDLNIFKLMLRLPLDQSIAQILDSNLSKQLIYQINPEFVELISDQKNSQYPMKNLVKLILD
jgi:hypothetical protein